MIYQMLVGQPLLRTLSHVLETTPILKVVWGRPVLYQGADTLIG